MRGPKWPQEAEAANAYTNRGVRASEQIPGARTGRLLLIRKIPSGEAGVQARWLCLCDCGKDVTVRADNIASGRTQSCGCLRGERDDERRLYLASRKNDATAEDKAAYFRHLWATRGVLYGPLDDAAMTGAA